MNLSSRCARTKNDRRPSLWKLLVACSNQTSKKGDKEYWTNEWTRLNERSTSSERMLLSRAGDSKSLAFRTVFVLSAAGLTFDRRASFQVYQLHLQKRRWTEPLRQRRQKLCSLTFLMLVREAWRTRVSPIASLFVTYTKKKARETLLENLPGSATGFLVRVCCALFLVLLPVLGFCEHWMVLVRITSWYPNFNGSHFGLPSSEIHRMTGLPPQTVWTMTYSHSPISHNFPV